MDKATVKKVATLARLHVSEEETEKYAAQLGGIFKWIEQMNEVNVDNVKPLASVIDMPTPLRADVVNDGDMQADILANAPEAVEGFFVVPKVIE